jgi:hypothetical protein
MRRLVEERREFRIRGILPLEGAALDASLMPDIPGLTDKKNCREWEPGVPIELDRIRDKDQAYWDRYRGTPKAFIRLRTGQRIWNNRFGDLTAVRYPDSGEGPAAIETCLKQGLTPAALGLFFAPIRERALAATSPAVDFGQLFLGFSAFLILAALILTALLFSFGVQQRAEEMGALLAVGSWASRGSGCGGCSLRKGRSWRWRPRFWAPFWGCSIPGRLFWASPPSGAGPSPGPG